MRVISYVFPIPSRNLKCLQRMEFLMTTATGQVGLWYSDYIDYKYVLQKDMISK